MLRFLSGDLSYFGGNWDNARIFLHDHKLSSPYFPNERLTPADMHQQHARIYNVSQIEINQLRQRIKHLENQLMTKENATNNNVIALFK